MNENPETVGVIEKEDVETAGAVEKSAKLYYRIIKRAFDLLISTVGIVLLIPVIVLVKLLYICTGDLHSIFLVQKRIGKGGKEFSFFKFRTMVSDADIVLEEILNENSELAEEYKANKKLERDPRITKAGGFIRRFSIDELPQVLNIFAGKMTVIGNRPYLPREKEDMGDYFSSIVSTKPGLTGYWQVSGRSDVSFLKRLQLEQYYSEHCCLKLDISIFFKTFKVVLFGSGAK